MSVMRQAWIVLVALVLLLGRPAWPAPTATPESVAQAYFAALQQQGLSNAAEFMHPDELAKFKAMLLPVVAAEDAAGRHDLREAMFGANASMGDAESSSPGDFMRAFMRFVAARTKDAKPHFDKIDVLGTIREGEIVHVLTRLQVGAGDLSIQQMEVISLKPSGDEWKLMLTGQMEGLAKSLRARVPPAR
jgi:hypothetical protein